MSIASHDKKLIRLIGNLGFALALSACVGKAEQGFVKEGGVTEFPPPLAPAPEGNPEADTIVSLAKSTIVAAGPVVANGTSQLLVTVTLKNAAGAGLSGITPEIAATNSETKNQYLGCAVTNAAGVSQCAITSTKAEAKIVQVTQPLSMLGPTIDFIADVPSISTSSVATTGPTVADGTSESSILVTLRDAHSNPVSGELPVFTATNTQSRNTITACGLTNSSGQSTCKLKSTYAETKSILLTSPLSIAGGTTEFTSGGLNLVVPLDFLSHGSSTTTTARIHNRSRIGIDTSHYDGNPQYFLELVGANSDPDTAYPISLIDQDGTVVASVTLPAAQAQNLRIREPFVPHAGTGKNYRLSFPASDVHDNVVIRTARIIIVQTGATKTRIYFPLLGSSWNAYTAGDAIGVSDSATSTSFIQGLSERNTQFHRDDSKFSRLSGSSPFTFEAVFAASNAIGSAQVALFDTAGTMVNGTELSVSGTTPSMMSVDIPATDSTFPNLSSFEMKAKSPAHIAYLYRAGIYVKLENLTKAEIPWRVARLRAMGFTALVTEGRTLVEKSKYSNPKIYFEVHGSASSTPGATVELQDAGATPDAAGGTLVAGSLFTMGTVDKTVQRSADLTNTLVDGNHYIMRNAVVGPTGKVNQCLLVYEINQ